jgi:hypothetical protein
MGSKKLFLAIVLLGASAFAQNNLVPVPPELDSLGGVLRFVERQLGPIDSRPQAGSCFRSLGPWACHRRISAAAWAWSIKAAHAFPRYMI